LPFLVFCLCWTHHSAYTTGMHTCSFLQ
jgi:hypothetical protein